MKAEESCSWVVIVFPRTVQNRLVPVPGGTPRFGNSQNVEMSFLLPDYADRSRRSAGTK